MSMTQRYAGMLRRHAAEWDKQAMPVQAEATRQAARHMEDRERELLGELAAERTRIVAMIRAAASHGCACADADALADLIEGDGR